MIDCRMQTNLTDLELTTFLFSSSFASMKVTGYILALYMAILAITPCCTFDDCPENQTQSEQAANHDTDDDDCGNCSPFFNCNGCSSVSVNLPATHFHLTPLIATRAYTEFIQPFMPEVHYDFWQPPRLA